MAQWTMTDEAAGSPKYANTSLNVTKNQTELFNNTTEDDVITDQIVGVFGVSESEMSDSGEAAAVPHAGWVLRKEGTGGRAGRVHYEVLVAGSSMTGDGTDDTIFPDFSITITTQPSDDESATGEAVTFSVAASTTPSGGTLSYQWQLSTDDGASFDDVTEAGVYSDVDTDILAISDNTGLDGNQYRCVVSVTGGADVNSDAATLTETA